MQKLKFESTFNPNLLESKKIRILDLRPKRDKATLRYQDVTEFGNYRTYEMEIRKAVYSSFRQKYKRTYFKNGKEAAISIYDGDVTDIEVLFDPSEYEGIENMETTIISMLENAVNSIRLDPRFKEGWFYDGNYLFYPLMSEAKEVFNGVVKIPVESISMTNLKASSDSFVRKGRIILGVSKDEELMLTPTVSSVKKKGLAYINGKTIWDKLSSYEDGDQNGFYVNLEAAIKYHSVLGNCYGNDSAKEIDIFNVCLSIGAFPYQVDDSAKILAEYVYEGCTRIEGIFKMVYSFVSYASNEKDLESLRKLSRFFSFLTAHGVSHIARAGSLYKEGGYEKVKEHKFVDILGSIDGLRVNVGELTLEEINDNKLLVS